MEGLPEKILKQEHSFILVHPKKKNPIEVGWQTQNNYPYNSPKLIQHITNGGNVGIICGEQSDGLRILDDDTPDKELIKIFEDTFGKTFRVRDHFYFKFDTRESDKIILNHKTKQYPNSKGKLSHHAGEIQGTSTFCVTCPSIHPNGSSYKLIDDIPIQIISYEKFKEVFDDYLQQPKKAIVRTPVARTTFSGDNISDIPLSSIISFGDLEDVGNNALQGSHPLHGSDGGMNFRINTTDNTWYCFRCQAGGGPSELIAVMEGIIECGDAGANCFTTDQGQEVISVAREKYGLTAPEQDLGEVRGWANSVSIVGLAKKRNFEKCPKCDTAWRFEDSHGLYYCDTCKYGGGLPQFADMIIEERNRKIKAEGALSKL